MKCLAESIFTLLYLFLDNNIDSSIVPKGNDILYLMILGVICTSLAYLISVEIMKKIKPFTMNISVNLEPIYAIILAIIFFKDQEIMSVGFLHRWFYNHNFNYFKFILQKTYQKIIIFKINLLSHMKKIKYLSFFY